MRVLEIRLPAGTSRILIGESIRRLDRHLPEGTTVFVTDRNVRELYPSVFDGRPTVVVPPGEDSKSLKTAAGVYDELLDLGADRSTFVAAVGGGVVCDLAGFAAATFLRGLRFGYAATTLLAQADASVGGKTGVNFRGYKNMIGVFRQPEFVVCDPGCLATLPAGHVLGGLAEVIKSAAVADPVLFDTLERRHREVLALREDVLEEVVAAAVAVKAGIVQGDEKEAGARRVLNFGHTLGHAFESTMSLTHGEAVSAGMAAAADLSVRRGLLPEAEAGRLRALLETIGLPSRVPFDRPAAVDAVRRDKKREGGRLKFVFLRAIGEAVVEDLEIGELEGYIHDLR